MQDRLTIGIKATQIGPGGGMTHLVNCLKWFPVLAPDTKFIVYAVSGHEPYLHSDHKNIEFRFYHIPSFGLPARLLWEQTALPEFLSRDRCDLILEPGNYAIKNPPCPSVLLIHNLAPFIPEYIETESAYQQFRLRLLRHGTTLAIASSAGTIFLSQFARDVLRHHVDLSGVRSTVIYHGANDQLTVQPTAREDFILCVSHIYRYKGILELIKAYSRATSTCSDFPRLLIAGEPYDRPYMAQIENQIAVSGIREKVRFLGSIPESRLAQLYQTCKYFVFPSTIENCPNILIEALAAGCPILSSDSGVMPEICGEAVRYCSPSNIEGFADSLIELHRNDSIRNSLSDRASSRASRFSWQSTAQQTLDFLSDVLAQPISGCSQIFSAENPSQSQSATTGERR